MRLLLFAVMIFSGMGLQAQFSLSGKIRTMRPITFSVVNINGDTILAQRIESNIPFQTNPIQIQEDYYTLHFGDLKKSFIMENKALTVKGFLDDRKAANTDLVLEGSPFINKMVVATFDFKNKSGKWNWDNVKDSYPPLLQAALVYESESFFSTDYERIAELAAKFSDEDRKSLLAQKIENMASHMKQFAVGSKSLSVSLPDRNGTIVNLSDFRGKLVLIDFWASWCGPCRAEMQSLKKIYEEIKGDDLAFISISLDEERDRWLKAMDTDKIPWIMLWEQKGLKDSELGTLFGFKSIPFIVLIDKDGTLLARGLRGEDVRTEIEKYRNK